MRSARREAAAVLATAAVSALAHAIGSAWLDSSVVGWLVAATMIPWLLTKPARYLIGLTLIAELFSVHPVGIVTGALWLPWLFFRARGHIEVDISFRFAGLLLATVVGQLLILLSPDTVTAAIGGTPFPQIVARVPWIRLGILLAATTGLLWALINVILNQLPFEQRSTISLTGYKLGS